MLNIPLADFASLPQKPRTDDEATLFATALKVMAHLYAHSSTLVLQHPLLPADFPPEQPTYETSGWCTFESACSQLAIEGGGRLVVLGTGRVKVRAQHRRTPDEMSVAFSDETKTRFVGKADRESVAALYKGFYDKVVAYDRQRIPFIVKFGGRNWAALTFRARAQRGRLLLLMLALLGPPVAVSAFLAHYSCVGVGGTLQLAPAFAVCIAIVLFAPARTFRAKAASCFKRVLSTRMLTGASAHVAPGEGSSMEAVDSPAMSYDSVHEMYESDKQ